MPSMNTTAPPKTKNDPQTLKNIGDINPACLRVRLINLNAITENPTAIVSSAPNIISVLIWYESFTPYSRGFRQTTK